MSKLRDWVESSAENIEKYNRWLNLPETKEILQVVAKDAGVLEIPYTLARPDTCTYVLGISTGMKKILDIIAEAGTQRGIRGEAEIDYNTVQTLIQLGYKQEDAVRIVKQNKTIGEG